MASPSGKAEACKASIPQFESGCHLLFLQNMLYIVATPIGNLSDISLRALDVLKTCDAVLCEDTRVSKILLNHYQIEKPLISYHSFNEKQKLDMVVQRLLNGENLALISDAGTPLFQDPGHLLIQECQAHQIPYTSIPGASSILSALILSGFTIDRFQFLGFLPKKPQELKEVLSHITTYDGLTVVFESPKRVKETLEILNSIDPSINLAVIREITKKFETVHKGTASELSKEFSLNDARGEIVLVIKTSFSKAEEDFTDFAFELIANGISKKTAYQLASRLGPVNKDLIYKS